MLQRVLMPYLDGAKAGGYESKSAAYQGTKDGMFLRPVKVGKHAFVPSNEVQALIDARISGADDAAIRKLVEQLHQARGAHAPAKPTEPPQLANARARRAGASQ